MVLQTEIPVLDSRYTARPTQTDDLEAVVDLLNAADRAYYDADIHTVDNLRNEWENDKFNLAHSTRVVLDSDDKIVGYIEVYDLRAVPVRPHLWLHIHPDHDVQHIGIWLLAWAEQRAREVFDRVPEDARVVLEIGDIREKTHARELFESFGMTTERSFYSMLIEMDEAPPAPEVPEDIRLTSWAENPEITIEDLYRALKASFQDHRGHVPEPFEEGLKRFTHYFTTDKNVTPEITLLAMDGDKIAGISYCRAQSWDAPDNGHVNSLGVLREYRRRGLGMALLRHSFKTFWDMGQNKVDLGVDAVSLTNAVALYERAGMHVHRVFDSYEKELRPGKEYSKQ